MQVTLVEIMVDSNNEFIGIVEEIWCQNKKKGDTIYIHQDMTVNRIDIVDDGIVINVTR
jgi:hypothetical protein